MPWTLGKSREHWCHGLPVRPFGLQPHALPAVLVDRQQRERTEGLLRIGKVTDEGPGAGRMDTNAQCRIPGVTDGVFAYVRFQPAYAGVGESNPVHDSDPPSTEPTASAASRTAVSERCVYLRIGLHRLLPQNVDGLLEKIGRARCAVVTGAARVLLTYEAGYEGFWLAWRLEGQDLEVIICDPASLKVVRRKKKKIKTDIHGTLRSRAICATV